MKKGKQPYRRFRREEHQQRHVLLFIVPNVLNVLIVVSAWILFNGGFFVGVDCVSTMTVNEEVDHTSKSSADTGSENTQKHRSYQEQSRSLSEQDSNDKQQNCACGTISNRPNIMNKVETARWMVHNINYGILTTISTRSIIPDPSHQKHHPHYYSKDPVSSIPIPFGNVYSFIDGSCANATGTPYFYATIMDQSIQDVQSNNMVSFTLSEASIDTLCMLQDDQESNPIHKACHITAPPLPPSTDVDDEQYHRKTSTGFGGDPESPLCARLTITGRLIQVTPTTTTNQNDEYHTIQQAFYERHYQMKYWPIDHNWSIYKLHVMDVWFINYFGGATIISPEEYLNYTL